MDAHFREYAAAADALRDQTPDPFSNIAADDGAALDVFCGSQRSLPAVGDFVSGMTRGKRWSGHVLTVEPGRLAVECAGAWIVVDPADITH